MNLAPHIYAFIYDFFYKFFWDGFLRSEMNARFCIRESSLFQLFLEVTENTSWKRKKWEMIVKLRKSCDTFTLQTECGHAIGDTLLWSW